MDFNKLLSSLRIHLSFAFKFSLQGSHHVYCPFPAGEFKRKEFLFFCLNGCYFITFLPVPCRYVVVGGVPGSRRAGGVFVFHVFNSSNVFGAAVPSEGWNVRAPGRDPLCHDGECNILLQRSEFAQIKVISIADTAFSSIHINYNN